MEVLRRLGRASHAMQLLGCFIGNPEGIERIHPIPVGQNNDLVGLVLVMEGTGD